MVDGGVFNWVCLVCVAVALSDASPVVSVATSDPVDECGRRRCHSTVADVPALVSDVIFQYCSSTMLYCK